MAEDFAHMLEALDSIPRIAKNKTGTNLGKAYRNFGWKFGSKGRSWGLGVYLVHVGGRMSITKQWA